MRKLVLAVSFVLLFAGCFAQSTRSRTLNMFKQKAKFVDQGKHNIGYRNAWKLLTGKKWESFYRLN